jgi:hypothetical protein
MAEALASLRVMQTSYPADVITTAVNESTKLVSSVVDKVKMIISICESAMEGKSLPWVGNDQ